MAEAIRCFHAERARAGLWLPVAFGLGIYGYFGLADEPPLPSGFLALVAGFLMLRAVWRRAPGMVPAMIFLLAVMAGFTAAQIRTWSVSAPVLQRDVTGMLEGVVDTVRRTPRGYRAIIRVEALGRLPPEALPARARVLLLKRGPVPEPGAYLRVFGRFGPPPAPVSPHARDFARALFFRNIGATGFALAPANVQVSAAPTWRSRLDILRQRISSGIRAHLPGDTGAIAAALLVGDRDGISDPARRAMRDAGIAHLLAISGLHMGLVAGCVFSSVRLLLSAIPGIALLWPTRILAAGAALIFAILYLFLSGAAVPTLRAFVMTSIVLLGVMIGRRAISMRLLAVAALAILALRPEFLLGASFQLSFAAVTCLVAVHESGRLNNMGRGSTGLAGGRGNGFLRRLLYPVLLLALSSLVATLATLPVTLHHFQKGALYGVVSNMLAVPAAGVWIMPSGVGALVLMPFGLEAIPLTIMGWGIDLVLGLAREVAEWPHATHPVVAAPDWVAGMAAAGGLWLCIWQTRWRFLGAPPLVAALVLLLFPPWPPPTILISDGGGLVGVFSEGRLETTSRRTGFGVRVWRRRAGLPERAGPEENRGQPGGGNSGTHSGARFECDLLGCVFRSPETGSVVWSASAQSLEEDCLHADILITRIRVPENCPGPHLVLGPGELRAGGATVIRLEGGRFQEGQPERGEWKIVQARDIRGRRPWSGADAVPGKDP